MKGAFVSISARQKVLPTTIFSDQNQSKKQFVSTNYSNGSFEMIF